MAGERWKSNESQFRGCRSSIMNKFRQHRTFRIYISRVSLFTGWVGDRVDMSLIDCAKLENSSLEEVESRSWIFVTLRASKVVFS